MSSNALLPRFYPILDTATVERADLNLVSASVALLTAGAGILQLRHKGHFSRGLFTQAEHIASLCRQAGALFIVNDRADMGALLSAGLHLGQDDIPPCDARKLLPNAVVGFSTHNEAQLSAAENEPVNYLALGPIFETGSKPKPDPVLGPAELHRLRPLTSKPLVAIGGISLNTARAVIEAGADSVAVVADLFRDVATLSALQARAAEWISLLAN